MVISVLLWPKGMTWYHKLLNNTDFSMTLVRKLPHQVYIFHNNNSNIILCTLAPKLFFFKSFWMVIVVTDGCLAFLSSWSSAYSQLTKSNFLNKIPSDRNMRYFRNSPHKTPETGTKGVLETPTSSLAQSFPPLFFLKNLQSTFSNTIFPTLM